MAKSDTATLLNEAWRRLASLPGVEHVNPSGLDCHPRATGLVIQDLSPIALLVCVKCLTAYVRTSDGSTYSHALGKHQRRCAECGIVADIECFMSRNGFPVRFCAACRTAWSKAKKEADAVAAEVEEKLADESVRANLGDMRARLERLERELSE